MNQAARVIHFGIDGGSFRVLDALASRGVMPEYARLRKEGGSAVLRSTIPWFTVPAWVTWMTGVAAERHGLIYWTAMSPRDYWERAGQARKFVTSTDVPYPTVFELLSDAGIPLVSINMPVTFPPPKVNGVMVAGFGSPPDPERAAHPPGFLRAYPEYRIDLEDSVPAVLGGGRLGDQRTHADIVSYATRLADMAEARHRVVMDVLSGGFGLVSVVYVGADRLSHVAWPEVRAILHKPARTETELAVESYYRTLDRVLGETRLAARGSLFLVTSYHGQGPPPDKELALNVWLHQRGWLALRGSGVRRVAHAFGSTRLRRGLWNAWRRVRNIPVGASPYVEWNRTVAYGIPMSHCRAYGVAVRGDRRFQEEIGAALLDLVDPETDLHPVERILFAEDLCQDGARSRYPELVALLHSDYGVTSKLNGQAVRKAAPGVSAYHEPEGILLAAGAGVLPGEHADASIADIAPTVLSAAGVAPPSHMDGKQLPWIVESSPALRPPDPVIRTGVSSAVLTEEDEAIMARHLRDLGYID